MADKDGFDDIILVFGANLLKRSLSIIGGSTRSSDTLTNIVDVTDVKDLRGAYRI